MKLVAFEGRLVALNVSYNDGPERLLKEHCDSPKIPQESYVKLRYDRFLPHPFQFII
jgi:hypothetical protein